MAMYLYLCLLGILFNHVHSYVLLQVSKDEQNRSNVDALIHKVVPSGQYDKIAAKISRKQFPSYPTRIEQSNSVYSHQEIQTEEPRKERAREENRDQGENVNFVMNIINDLLKWKPVVRAKNYQIEPEVVNFRSSKPSLLYEVSADTFINAIKDILSSKTVHNYIDVIARRAAAVYRTMRDTDVNK